MPSQPLQTEGNSRSIDEQKSFAADQVDQFVQGTHEDAKPIFRALLQAQSRHKLFHAQSPLLLAVSGGADSICLLHALHQLAPYWQLSLHVAHLDHNLRPDSGQDAAFVVDFAAKLALPCHVESIEVPQRLETDMNRAGGIEAIARTLRYDFLRRVAMEIHKQSSQQVTVVTAHHQDDQAETLLLHMLQGSGLQGLGGMAWVGQLPDTVQPPIRLVRPLLGIGSTAIHTYLRAYGLHWREDSSNLDERYLRNHLRHSILPMLAKINPNIHATLARTADLLAAEAEHANQRDQAALIAATSDTPQTHIRLNLFQLTQVDLATQRGILRQAMLKLGIDLREIGMDGIDALLQQAHSAQQTQTISGPHPLLADWAWTILAARPVGETAADDTTNGGAELLLALHRAAELPSVPTHPHMGAPIQTPIPLPIVGEVVYNQWQLQSNLIAPNDLPINWRSRNQPWHFFGDADTLQAYGELRLETFRAGMTIAPLGMHGHKRALGDIFTDRKIAPWLRAGWPVITGSDGTVLWLCGLVISHHIRIQPQSHQVRHLLWQPAAQCIESL